MAFQNVRERKSIAIDCMETRNRMIWTDRLPSLQQRALKARFCREHFLERSQKIKREHMAIERAMTQSGQRQTTIMEHH